MLSCNGHSALPAIRSEYPTIASTSVTRVVQIYSVGKQGEMVEITTGIHLLGAPVGSQAFAEAFLLEAMDRTRTDSNKLHEKITGLQIRLRLFEQCVIEQLPHLLGNEVLHNAPLSTTMTSTGKNGKVYSQCALTTLYPLSAATSSTWITLPHTPSEYLKYQSAKEAWVLSTLAPGSSLTLSQ